METVLQIQWIEVTLETYAAYSNKLMKFFAVSKMRRDTVLNTEYPIGAKEHMVQWNNVQAYQKHKTFRLVYAQSSGQLPQYFKNVRGKAKVKEIS